MEALSGQVSSFVMVMLTGAAWGILYDMYNSRERHGTRRKRNDPGDLGFWLCSVLLIGLGLIVSNWLELRFFVAVGLVLGYMVYAVMVRPITRPLLRGLNSLGDRIAFPIAQFKNRLLMRSRIRRVMKVNEKR